MMYIYHGRLKKGFNLTFWIAPRAEKAEPLEKELLFTLYSTFSFLSVSTIDLNIAVADEENT